MSNSLNNTLYAKLTKKEIGKTSAWTIVDHNITFRSNSPQLLYCHPLPNHIEILTSYPKCCTVSLEWRGCHAGPTTSPRKAQHQGKDGCHQHHQQYHNHTDGNSHAHWENRRLVNGSKCSGFDPGVPYLNEQMECYVAKIPQILEIQQGGIFSSAALPEYWKSSLRAGVCDDPYHIALGYLCPVCYRLPPTFNNGDLVSVSLRQSYRNSGQGRF